MVTPSSVRVRAYRVGFGDCLLVTIGYDGPLDDGRTERHVLVDFGTKARATGGPTILQTAAKIAEHCGGVLDVVVATHRHQDHVGGFRNQGAFELLEPLRPRMMIRPWPDAPEAARADPAMRLDADSLGFFGLLDEFAARSLIVSEAAGGGIAGKRARDLAELGASPPLADDRLADWTPPERCVWVRAGEKVDVAGILPEVSIEVLGPPTLEQVPGLKSYASSSAEYWLGFAVDTTLDPGLLAPRDVDDLVRAKETVAAPDGLGRAAWLLDKLDGETPGHMLDIVEGFDDVLNNTSVVLLVTVGERTLLLAGDAQVENWSYTLDRVLGDKRSAADDELRSRLADVDLYKVGHHGSRNATPRRLVELWRTARRADHPLCSVLSTKGSVFARTVEGKVPKPELVQALASLGELHSTESLGEHVWWFDVVAAAKGSTARFRYEAGPAQA